MPFTGPFEDRLALRELLDAYADAVNLADASLWGALWAQDSIWALPDYPEIGEIHGRDAIVQAWVAAMAHYPGVVFTTTPGAIEVDGDRAQLRSYTSEVYDQAGVTKRDRGRYDDIAVRQGGVWRFSLRRFRNIHRA
jgi:hypothetical protein